jgi:hypothetical protein
MARVTDEPSCVRTERPLKPIKDLRFFERTHPDVSGAPGPDHLGTLYPAADRRELHAASQRYAQRLRQDGFRTRGYDHIYVTLTPLLEEGRAQVAARQLEPWFVFVDVGVPLERWPQDPDAQHHVAIDSATRALLHLCEVDNLAPHPIPAAAAAVLEMREELELTRLEKENSAYWLLLTYRILPYGKPCPVFLEYQDKRSGRSGRIRLMELRDWEDVFPLFGSVSVTGGVITFRPRDSERAGLTVREYRHPVRVAVERVLGAREG